MRDLPEKVPGSRARSPAMAEQDLLEALATATAALRLVSRMTPGLWGTLAEDPTFGIYRLGKNGRTDPVVEGDTPAGLGGDPALSWASAGDPAGIVALYNAVPAFTRLVEEVVAHRRKTPAAVIVETTPGIREP